MAKKHAAAQNIERLEDEAADRHIWEISLDQIRPAPWNPPARMDPKTVGELAESIRTQGQQIPVLLRPVDDCEPPVRYELVFGHRRFAALQLLEGQTFTFAIPNGGPVAIKAFIRNMTEEQAMILSGIENLQRQGFTDIEEAEFFKTAGERYGESAVKMLAEKLSVSERYIRKRVEILRLPESALKLWREGTWHVGHMEQLLRIHDADKIESFLREQDRNIRKELGVWQLKGLIDQRAVSLSAGRFDKAECKLCTKNSECQLRLWGTEKEKGALCLDAKCFLVKQQGWHDVNWSTCKANKYGTQKAHITDGYDRGTGMFQEYGSYKVPERCRSCESFTTIIRVTGQIWQELACFGDGACYSQAVKEMNRAAKGSSCDSSGSGDAGADPDGPRVAWHGEFYRQEFYKSEMPKLLDGLLTEDPRRLQLALAFMVHGVPYLHEWFCKKLEAEAPKGLSKYQYAGPNQLKLFQILDLVKPQNPLFCEYLMAQVVIETALHDRRTYELTLNDEDRQAIAEFLQVDFRQFEVSEDYLQKKTKSELIRFIVHDSGLAVEEEFQKAFSFSLPAGEPGKFAKVPRKLESLATLKKPALISLILNCGVNLRGRLPAEIANRPKLGEK